MSLTTRIRTAQTPLLLPPLLTQCLTQTTRELKARSKFTLARKKPSTKKGYRNGKPPESPFPTYNRLAYMRPDIAFAMEMLSKNSSNPGKEPWSALTWASACLHGILVSCIYLCLKRSRVAQEQEVPIWNNCCRPRQQIFQRRLPC